MTTSPYQGPRRTTFKIDIYPSIKDGEMYPKNPPPPDVPAAELHFLGITQSKEFSLLWPCWHDLWLHLPPNGKPQFFAVYGPGKIRTSGTWRAWGGSPALTEARRRALDMGLVSYSVEHAARMLELVQQEIRTPAAQDLFQEEVCALEIAIQRNFWIKFLRNPRPASRLIEEARRRHRDDSHSTERIQRLVSIYRRYLGHLEIPPSVQQLLR